MQHAARMGIGNGVGDGGERGQQGDELQGIGAALGPFGMIGVNGVREGAAADEFHGVERLVGARTSI